LLAWFIGLEEGLKYFNIIVPPDSQIINWWLQAVQSIVQALLGVLTMAFTFCLFRDFQNLNHKQTQPTTPDQKLEKTKIVIKKKTSKTKK
jgi:hypothetical protein